MNGQSHNDNDRDEVLARRIGRLREEGRPLASDPELADDPLVQALLAFEAGTAPDVVPERQERLWQAIQARMREPSADRRPLRRLPVGRSIWYRAAAVVLVLVAAGLGWWLYLGRETPHHLVASAGATQQVYTAPDTSRITLRPHSRLYLVAASETSLQYRLEGEAYFDVTYRPERRFQVLSGPVRVTVLGTRFDVRTWSGVEVFLEEGQVQLEGPHGQQQVLAAGQRSRLTADGRLTAPEPAPAETYLDWMRGRLTFTREPAARVTAELAHHFGVRIELPEPHASQQLSGTLLLDSLAPALQDLGRVLEGRFVEVAPGHYRFEDDAVR
ncbi:FecR domain-containing protein [Rhodocaloribacter litoris]|uniref:FecR family protein n=1 Tax=Rhodocaloribacter litoris TaxID=2558931 RepID=UPI00141F22B2|nr:FecR domain-containing protein [Rhodocaloribacter litoris]QXD15349.1 FecR domain-containing protein [Rhodocaloribacter litoris]